MRRGGRQTLREQRERANAADRFYAAMSGKEPQVQNSIKPKQQRRAAGWHGKPLEKAVLASVLDALRRDPRVAMVERQQSGVFVEGNRHIRVGSPGALDVKGFLIGSGRYFEIECKRPGGQLTPQQSERIATLIANGAIAGVATSAAEALELLP